HVPVCTPVWNRGAAFPPDQSAFPRRPGTIVRRRLRGLRHRRSRPGRHSLDYGDDQRHLSSQLLKAMKRLALNLFLGSLLLAACSCDRPTEAAANPRVVRCAVIGGMTMTGLWPELAKMFEADTGYQIEVVVTGPRPILDEAMRAGKVDFLTMHSGDISTDLVA